MYSKTDSIEGCLLGTAIGDSVGLPCENFSKKRQSKLFPNLKKQNLIFGKGMISDDTEHTLLIAQSLVYSAGNVKQFQKYFAGQLKQWFLGLPAGIGNATAKAILKLLIGVSAEKSGVSSAGNGPSMRSSIIGVCYGDNPNKLKELIQRSSRITHIDKKAEVGAYAVAYGAYLSSITQGTIEAKEYCLQLSKQLDNNDASEEFLQILNKMVHSLELGQSTTDYANGLGLSKGVTGYTYHTVPIALHCWLSNQHDFEDAIISVIRCGGDTDSTAAIVGGIIGASMRKDQFPQYWLNNIWE